MPNILLTRIDNRLVHGQVGVTWTKTIGANLLLVADDDAAKDELQQRLMAVTAKSSGCGIRFFTIEKTAAIINKAAPNQKIFIIVRTPHDAVRSLKRSTSMTKTWKICISWLPRDLMSMPKMFLEIRRRKLNNFILREMN